MRFKWIKFLLAFFGILTISIFYSQIYLKNNLTKFNLKNVYTVGPIELHFSQAGKMISRWINPCLFFENASVELKIKEEVFSLQQFELCSDLWNKHTYYLRLKGQLQWRGYWLQGLQIQINSKDHEIENFSSDKVIVGFPEESFFKEVLMKPQWMQGWPVKWHITSGFFLLNDGLMRFVGEGGLDLELQWVEKSGLQYYDANFQVSDFYMSDTSSYLHLANGKWAFQIETDKTLSELINEYANFTHLSSVKMRHEIFQLEEIEYQDSKIPVHISADLFRSLSMVEK